MPERRNSSPVDRRLPKKISRYFTKDREDVPMVVPCEPVPLVKMVEDLVREERIFSEENSDKSPIEPTRNEFLRKARFKKGLKQYQLRELAEVQGSTRITQFEKLAAWPTVEEEVKIARVLGVSAEKIFPPYLREYVESRFLENKKSLDVETRSVPLDQVTEDELERALEQKKGTDIYRDETVDSIIEKHLRKDIDYVMDYLTAKERRVIYLRFGLDNKRARTLEEVGQEFGVHRERIRQIEAKALSKLRYHSRAKYLKDYAEETSEGGYAKEALLNGAVNAICQKDYARAKENLDTIERRILDEEYLQKREKRIIRIIKSYPFAYRWSEETIATFLDWYSKKEGYIFLFNGYFVSRIVGIIQELQEIWRLRSQIS